MLIIKDKFLLIDTNSQLVQKSVLKLNCHVVTPYNVIVSDSLSPRLPVFGSTFLFSISLGADFHRKLLGKPSPLFHEAEFKREQIFLCY